MDTATRNKIRRSLKGRRLYKYYRDKYEVLYLLGFDSYQDGYTALYDMLQSTNKVGRLVGESGCSVHYKLKRWGVPLRPRGGANNIKRGRM